MTLVVIAWRSIWRSKRRSCLSLAAVAVACGLLIFMMAVQKGSYANMIENAVSSNTGHVQIQHRDYLEDRSLLNAVASPQTVLAALSRLPSVRGTAPRVEAPVLVSKGKQTFGALLVGVDPEQEKGLSRIPRVITAGAWLAADDPDGVVLGHDLATNLAAAVGDEVVFLGQARDGSIAAGTLTVRGIFEVGMDELDRTVLVCNLRPVQEAHDMGDAVTCVAVLLKSDRDRPAVVRALRKLYPPDGELAVREWPELLPGVMQSIRLDWSSGVIIYAVLVLVVAFGVANTFLMAFIERIREYGVLLALGMGPARLGLLVYLESVLLTAVGLAVGTALGSGAAYWLQTHGWKFGTEGHITSKYGVDPVLHGLLTWEVVGWAVGIVLCLTLLMAVYPAVKAARLKPVEAMRQA